MQNSKLVMKRCQSECLPYQAQIVSPSPIKLPSRLNSRLASEIFDMASDSSDASGLSEHLIYSKPSRARFCSARIDYEFTKEWNSESSCTTSSQGDCDSPNGMITKNPYHQEHIFEEIAADIPTRSSNPIINDSKFKRNDGKSFESTSQEKLFSKMNAFGF